MSSIPFLIILWLVFLIPAGSITAICRFLGRHRVTWQKWELAILLAPYGVWMILTMLSSTGKSLSNAIVEPFCLGSGVALACIARVVAGRKWNEDMLAISLFVACCVLAVALWAFMSAIPE